MSSSESTGLRLTAQAIRAPGLGPVALELPIGACTTLAGESGSGKTRLLRALIDFDPNEGEVWLDGEPRSRFAASEWRRRVAMLPAESRWWRETARVHLRGDDSSAMLDALALPLPLADAPLARLSSGERQRFAIVRLLGNRPRVLLLDEPTANLDTENTRRVERLLRQYVHEHAAAVLWVSHDRAQAERLGVRRLTMHDGRLLQARAA